MLLKSKGDLDVVDLSGKTALYYAIESRNETCVRLLLAAGASPFLHASSLYQKKIHRNIPQDMQEMINKAKLLKVIRKFKKFSERKKLFK